MGDIEKQFNDGIDAIYNLVNKNQLNGLIALGRKLVSDILPKEKEYKNMTGNTVTSYAFGIYQNGKMIYLMKNTIRAELLEQTTNAMGRGLMEARRIVQSEKGKFINSVEGDTYKVGILLDVASV